MMNVMKQIGLLGAHGDDIENSATTLRTATGVLLATVAMATGGGKAAPPPTPEVRVIHVMDERARLQHRE
jgi:hypothetical protein